MFNRTLLDDWKDKIQFGRITTSSKKLDLLLGRGIQVGQITEICGGSGTGKTQTCFQICLNVQMPEDVGGYEGKAIFIDTNQDFSPSRIKEMASRKIQWINILRFHLRESDKYEFSTDKILDNINYIYCRNHIELIAIITLLPDMLKNDNKIKLIVIDSFSYLFRNYKESTSIVCQLITELSKMAIEFKLAILITNELTSVYKSGKFKLSSALGNSYAHKISQRIFFDRLLTNSNTNLYLAHTQKSINHSRTFFEIVDKGIRDYKNA